ncbi:MAG: hypothetical protein MI866_13025, partial [Bacteroidales bacterium]|nr:hypothetical protein [Bacteroidales bacterium]
MRKLISLILFFLLPILIIGQNENPYAQFGYEAPIMEQKKEQIEQLKVFTIINSDSKSEIGKLTLDIKNSLIAFYSKNGDLLAVDSLSKTSIARWLTTDPSGQYASPYLGMGNSPLMGVDPDGRKNVYYNNDGSYNRTEKNNFFHNLFMGTQNYVGDVKVSDALFWSWQSEMFPQALGSRLEDYRLGFNSTSEMIFWNGSMIHNPGCNPALELCHPEEFLLSLGTSKLIRSGTKEVAERVFWSGGDDAMNAAMSYAKSNGLKTLEMTRAGQNLTNLTKNMPWEEAAPMWNRLSAAYAKGAKGSVHVFQNAKTGV